MAAVSRKFKLIEGPPSFPRLAAGSSGQLSGIRGLTCSIWFTGLKRAGDDGPGISRTQVSRIDPVGASPPPE